MGFKDLVNSVFDFYGVDNSEFKLNEVVYEAIEDPDDGWRSYLSSIEVKESNGIFFKQPLAKIKVIKTENNDSDFDGFALVDVVDGHVWLQIGTDHSEDWYPSFTFHYSPKKQD